MEDLPGSLKGSGTITVGGTQGFCIESAGADGVSCSGSLSYFCPG